MRATKPIPLESKERDKHSRKRWTCNGIERSYAPVSAKEMRQILAEVLEIMLSSECQLQEANTFSSDLSSSQITKPRLQPKRKAVL
jgi:hypothetical protein